MSFNQRTYPPASASGRLVTGTRYSVRGLAVCLSVFLAACTGTAVKNDGTSSRDPIRLPQLQVASVGDIMLGTDFPDEQLPPDGVSLLEPVASTLRHTDIAIGNMQDVPQDGGGSAKEYSREEHCYVFRMPGHYVAQLRNVGYDVLTLTNNHARGFGEFGRDSTMALLGDAGVTHSCHEDDVAQLNVNGKKVSVIDFAPDLGSNDILAQEAAYGKLHELAKSNDVVIVSFHAGAEGVKHRRVRFSKEFFHCENRNDVVAFAHMAADTGADLALGHGLHIPQALERYHDRLIAYSLGNFATYWGIKVSGLNGVAPIVTASVDGKGRYVKGKTTSARQLRPVDTLPEKTATAVGLRWELARADFAFTALTIDQRGSIRVASPSSVSGAPPSRIKGSELAPYAVQAV